MRWREIQAIGIVLALAVSCAISVGAQSSAPEDKRKAKHLVQPTMPELARQLNLTGSVKVEIIIAPDGTVKSTRVIGGHPVLAQEAERAAKNSIFEPGPRETIETIEFKF